MSFPISNILAVALFSSPASAAEANLVLPSGLVAYLQESLSDGADSGLYRFRFVAPDFGAAENDFEVTQADLDYLCAEYAVPELSGKDLKPDQVIISLADRPSDFGVADPDAIQVFEAYSVTNGTCIWEAF